MERHPAYSSCIFFSRAGDEAFWSFKSDPSYGKKGSRWSNPPFWLRIVFDLNAGRLSIYDSGGKKNRTKIPNKKRKNKCVIYFIVIERREREGSCGVYDFYEEDAALSLASRTRASRESLHMKYNAIPSCLPALKKSLKDFFFSFPCQIISDNGNVWLSSRRQRLFFL